MLMSEPRSEFPRPATASPSPNNRKADRIITIVLWVALAGVAACVLVMKLVPRHPDMPVLWSAPRFALTDQDARPLSASDLRGHAYICDFIFTTCGSICPIMSHKMEGLQQQTPAAVKLVSFTVDPAHDTPAVLRQYAAAHHADSARWYFLTGPPSALHAQAQGMKVGVAASTPIEHSNKFFLVDGDGNVRGIYDSNDPQEMKSLAADAGWLASNRGAR